MKMMERDDGNVKLQYTEKMPQTTAVYAKTEETPCDYNEKYLLKFRIVQYWDLPYYYDLCRIWFQGRQCDPSHAH